MIFQTRSKARGFSVYLPADRVGGDTEKISKAEADFHRRGETILLVDDEVNVREMAHLVLEKLNLNPLNAGDGGDAMILVAEHAAALSAIITDLHMPGVDGLHFVRQVRRILPGNPARGCQWRYWRKASTDS